MYSQGSLKSSKRRQKSESQECDVKKNLFSADGERGQAKEGRQPLEIKKTNSRASRKECISADTLKTQLDPFWTFDLQNYNY